MDLSLKNNDRALWITITGLFIGSFGIRAVALLQTPYANGWDGYYYVMQVHSWVSYGHLQSSDYSLIYPYYIGVYSLVGNHELAFKVGSALLSALLTLALFRCAYRYSNKHLGTALFAGAFSLFSPGVTFMASQFPKNLLGIVFLLLFVTHIMDNKKIPALLFFLLAFFTHRMTAGLCLVILIGTYLPRLPLKYLIGVSLLALLASLLPGIFHLSDLSRFEGQLQWWPQFAPWSFYGLSLSKSSPWWPVELLLSGLTLPLFAGHLWHERLRHRRWEVPQSIFAVMTLVLLFPFFTFEPGSMGYRFFLVFLLVAPVLVVFAAKPFLSKYSTVLTAALLVASPWSYKAYNPKLHDAPNRLFEHIARRIRSDYSTQAYPLVIAHKSLAEMIIYKTDFDALNWAVPEGQGKDSVLRVVHHVPYIYLKRYFDREQLQQVRYLGYNYSIMPEVLWETLHLKAESNKDLKLKDLILHGNNPMEQRPYYLRKGKDL